MRLLRLLLLLSAVLGAAASAATIAAPAPAHRAQPAVAGGAACGVERWAVKTLTDPNARSITFRPRRAAILRCGAAPRDEFAPLTGLVTITGVGFWDFDHGQRGVTPNAIELHPVLKITGACT